MCIKVRSNQECPDQPEDNKKKGKFKGCPCGAEKVNCRE
jgi:hypothetical protein